MFVTGLRGVDKTVLLNLFEDMALSDARRRLHLCNSVVDVGQLC